MKELFTKEVGSMTVPITIGVRRLCQTCKGEGIIEGDTLCICPDCRGVGTMDLTVTASGRPGRRYIKRRAETDPDPRTQAALDAYEEEIRAPGTTWRKAVKAALAAADAYREKSGTWQTTKG